MMIIRQSIYILSIITTEMSKLKILLVWVVHLLDYGNACTYEMASYIETIPQDIHPWDGETIIFIFFQLQF